MPYHPSCCPLTHPSLSATVLPGCPRGARGPPAALERRGAAPLHADAGAEGGCSASGGGGRGIRCGGGGCCSGGRRGHCCTPRVRVLPGEGGGANPGTEPRGPCQDDIAGHDPITQGVPLSLCPTHLLLPIPGAISPACAHPTLSLQLGFRHTEVLGARLLHNGRPIMLRGVNRHEFDPRSGKVCSWLPGFT